MLILLFFVALAATQACPGCKWNACSTTPHGLQNCSQCQSGALTNVQLYIPTMNLSSSFLGFIGICEPCPEGCSTCSSGFFQPWWGVFVGVNCTECMSGYSYNYTSGGCGVCSSNCLACECEGDDCWSMICTTCAVGYALNSTHMYPYCYLYSTNATNTTSLQEEAESTSSSHSGAIIGLSIWGAVMTIAAVVFVVLYWRQRDAKPSTLLLGSETQVRQVTF